MTDERLQKLEKIMYVQDITIEAKAIYAYLCSFESFARNPLVSDILYDLNISKNRFHKRKRICGTETAQNRKFIQRHDV